MAELHPVRIDLPMPIRTQRLLIRPKHAGDGAITSAAVDIDWPGRQCDTGFWVRKSAQGQGFATEAANAIVRYGFGVPGMRRIGFTPFAVYRIVLGIVLLLLGSRLFNLQVPLSMRRYSIRRTHWLRQAGASKGSAKYCVSCTTLPLRNSMMLTVCDGRPW